MNSIKELNDFFAKHEMILIVDGHEWEGYEADFIRMVYKDGTIPKDEDKPCVDLRARVKGEEVRKHS